MNVLYVVSNAAAVGFTVERGDASLGLGGRLLQLEPFWYSRETSKYQQLCANHRDCEIKGGSSSPSPTPPVRPIS